MWELIVMGQIPGTHIQLNFNAWLYGVASMLSAWMVIKSSRALRQHKVIAMFRIRHIMQTAGYTQLLATRRHIQA